MTSAKEEKSESSSSDEDEESLRELVSCSHQNLYMNFQFLAVSQFFQQFLCSLLFLTFLGFFLIWGFLFINSALFSVVERSVDNITAGN